MFSGLFKNSIIFSLGKGLTGLISILMLPVITHYLSPAEFGVLESLLLLVMPLQLLMLAGLDSAQMRFYFDEGMDHSRLLRTSLAAVTVIGLGILTLFCLGVYLFPIGYVGELGVTLFFLLSIFVLINSISTCGLTILRAQNKTGLYVGITVLWNLIFALSAFLLLSSGVEGVYAMIDARIIGVVVMLLMTIWFVRQMLMPIMSFDSRLLRDMFKFGLPLIPAAGAMWLLNVADRIFVLHYLGEAALGIYALAFRIAITLKLLITGLRMAWPQFAYGLIGRDDQGAIYSQSLSYYFLFLSPIILIFTLFDEQLVVLLANENYLGEAQVIPLVGCYLLLGGAMTLASTSLSVAKKTGVIFYATLAGAVLNVLLNWFLVPLYGSVGAAVSSIIAFGFIFGYMWHRSNQHVDTRFPWARLGKIAFVISMLVLVDLYLIADSGLNGAYVLMVKALLAMAYLPSLFVLRFFTPGEIAYVRTLLSRAVRRRTV